VIIRENFPVRIMGTVIGGTTMAGGLGMAMGPLLGGMIYDHYATYSWMFVAAFGLGIGAFLLALTFKPFPKAASVTVATA
jgi:MFS family permease